MSTADDPRDTGRHLLGPHVVGQRIVVRRLVPGEAGPTGGPAFTDVLGVCLAWSAAECVVQPASGAAVVIPLDLIVSGKPVPPRPSVRSRVPASEAERLTTGLWADTWREDEDGDHEFWIASVSRVRRSLDVPTTPVDLAVSGDRATAGIGTGCDPVAEAEAAVSGDWIAIPRLLVEPGHRRRGHATALVAELLGWGAERGALTAAIRVPIDDDAGRELCERLGFEVHHRCVRR